MIPKYKGMMIWKLKDAAGVDPGRLAGMAKEAGFSWVAVKLANGSLDFNADLATKAIECLRLAGISRVRLAVSLWRS